MLLQDSAEVLASHGNTSADFGRNDKTDEEAGGGARAPLPGWRKTRTW